MNRTTALDELHSHLTPTQFSYLLSVLASSTPSVTNSEGISSERGFSSGVVSSSDSDKGKSVTDCADKSNSIASDSFGITTSIMLDRRWKIDDKFNYSVDKEEPSNQLVPFRNDSISIQSSTAKSTKSKSPPWNESRRVSMLALKSAASVISDDDRQDGLVRMGWNTSIAKNLQVVQNTYSNVPLPQVKFQGEMVEVGKNSIVNPTSSCSGMQVCKKIIGRYVINTMSRSSSTESVYAESLPDPDNPLVDIAGRIANEPVNPFPVLRMPPRKRQSQSRRSHFTDMDGIEEEIDKELRKFEDFREVSDFFHSKPKGKKVEKKSKKICNFQRRVTNPLYKVYDPSGYHKSEDELARECIQQICNDFNTWIQTLANSNEKMEGSEMKVEDIQPDFLIQILRKDLELPETNE